MSQENSGPIGCGVGRPCPLFQTLPNQPKGATAQGVCRLLPPKTIVVGMEPGRIDPKAQTPVTARVHDVVSANDVCIFHPALAESFAEKMGRSFLVALTESTLKHSRESGFNRAPSRAEAEQYMPRAAVQDDALTPSEREAACEHARHPGESMCYKCGAFLGTDTFPDPNT